MSDLFNNPMVNKIRKEMSQEDKENYRKCGEDIMKNWNENGEEEPKISPRDILIYIESALRSGLHPEDLTKKEQKFMRKVKGKKWKMLYRNKF